MSHCMRLERPGDIPRDENHLDYYGVTPERLLQLMTAFGMAFEDDPRPKWPEPKDYGCTYEDWNAVRYPEDADYDLHRDLLTPEREQKAAIYDAAVETFRAWHGKKDEPGIPRHKFITNDFWHVTEDECKGALEVWEKVKESFGDRKVEGTDENALELLIERSVDLDTWAEWIAFIELASIRGGFRVS